MLGFKGRFRHDNENVLHEIQSNVYSIIRHYRSESVLPVPKIPELIEGKQPWLMLSMSKTLVIAFFITIIVYGASEYWYFNRSQPILAQFNAINTSSVGKKNNKELINISSGSDIGKIVDNRKQELKETLQWEVVLAAFTRSLDAVRLVSELQQAGYEPFTRETDHGVELYIRAGDNLSVIRKLKNELNIRFDLNATIKRAQI